MIGGGEGGKEDMEGKMKCGLWSKDFGLVVVGQIISLFGNATVRFALPLYLLNQTGSAAIYGTVMALAFIPAVVLSPIGGLAADRVNKRNVMVVLDFFTAMLILAFCLLIGRVELVGLTTVTLMLLYGIAGAYQPSVQASIPVLVSQKNIMAANSVVNMVGSLASLAGPVLGGILYGTYGVRPVLWVCMACFLMSAVMELFIRIPFERQAFEGTIWKMAREDFAESFHFVCKGKPVIGKVMFAACGFNLFLSAMIIVAMPYMITEVFHFGEPLANRLYGFTQGILAAGGLLGGMCAGVFASRLSVKKAGNLIVISAACVLVMGTALIFFTSEIINCVVMTGCGFAIMLCTTVFTIQMLSFVQAETPQKLLGKVIAVILTVSMCAQPLGNALYGILFETCKGMEFVVMMFAGTVSMVIAVYTRGIFTRMSE